jgi:hypothetical protein
MFSVLSGLEMQQIVNAGSTNRFAETPPVTPVSYQNFNRSYPPPTVTAHYADSSYYSNFQEN